MHNNRQAYAELTHKCSVFGGKFDYYLKSHLDIIRSAVAQW